MDYWRGFGKGIKEVPDLLLFTVEFQRDILFVLLITLSKLNLGYKLIVG